MKRQSVSSMLMLVILVASVLYAPFTVRAQPRPNRFRGDTGVITLGLGQVLRITLSSEAFEDNAFVTRFNWTKYMPGVCNTEGVCRHVVQSEGSTAPVNVGPHQVASYEIQGTGNGVRLEVRVNTADVIADAQIINSSTGEVTSHVIMANTEGD